MTAEESLSLARKHIDYLERRIDELEDLLLEALNDKRSWMKRAAALEGESSL